MRKHVAILLAATLLAVPLTAVAKRSNARTATAPYNFDPSHGGITGWYGGEYAFFAGEAIVFETKPADRTVVISLEDDSGRTVSGALWQGEETTVFCGISPKVPIRGGKPVKVQVIVDLTFMSGPGCTTPELPTTGVATARFRS